MNFLHRRVRHQSAAIGTPHLDGDALFSAIMALGVKIMDLGSNQEFKQRSPAQQKEMLAKQVCQNKTRLAKFPPLFWKFIAPTCFPKRTDAIRRYNGIAFVVVAASHDRTFVDTVTRVNRRYEAAYEPIRATSFRDYSMGLTTSDVHVWMCICYVFDIYGANTVNYETHTFCLLYKKTWSSAITLQTSLYEKQADRFIPRGGLGGRAYAELRLGKADWPKWGSLLKSPVWRDPAFAALRHVCLTPQDRQQCHLQHPLL